MSTVGELTHTEKRKELKGWLGVCKNRHEKTVALKIYRQRYPKARMWFSDATFTGIRMFDTSDIKIFPSATASIGAIFEKKKENMVDWMKRMAGREV